MFIPLEHRVHIYSDATSLVHKHKTRMSKRYASFLLTWKEWAMSEMLGLKHNQNHNHNHNYHHMNLVVITCVHNCHSWDSNVFTPKNKKWGCALTENLPRTNVYRTHVGK